jgi:hypothetical protein
MAATVELICAPHSKEGEAAAAEQGLLYPDNAHVVSKTCDGESGWVRLDADSYNCAAWCARDEEAYLARSTVVDPTYKKALIGIAMYNDLWADRYGIPRDRWAAQTQMSTPGLATIELICAPTHKAP